ncbi:MAG: hypothetical protein R3F55_07855, partial [Alphaproteobacteria bacterium]
WDVVHVPDHFRGGNVESNCLRIALTDPAACVFLDGIWETLVNKRHFLEWAEAELRRHRSKSGTELDLTYSSRRLAALFQAGALSVSPARYAGRQQRLISYFRRRRRAVVWMALPMPPATHLDGLHYAGHYQCIPEWGDCLAAVNAAVRPISDALGARWFDTHALMQSHGGASSCLIDQWHFSRHFHQAIANELQRQLDAMLAEAVLSPDHPSHRFMLPRPVDDTPLTLAGSPDDAAGWRASHPGANVVGVAGDPDVVVETPVVVLLGDEAGREEQAAQWLARLPATSILLFPEELEPLRNPPGNERAEFAERNLRA